MSDAQAIVGALRSYGPSVDEWRLLASLFDLRLPRAEDWDLGDYLLEQIQELATIWPYFDVDSYLAKVDPTGRNELANLDDIGEAVIDWVRHGAQEGLSPSPLFCEAWYFATHRKSERLKSSKEAYGHYLERGRNSMLASHPNLSPEITRDLLQFAKGARELKPLPQTCVLAKDGRETSRRPPSGLAGKIHDELTSATCVFNPGAPPATSVDLRILIQGLGDYYERTDTTVSMEELAILSRFFDVDVFYGCTRFEEHLVSRVRAIGEFLSWRIQASGIGPLYLFEESTVSAADAVLNWLRGDWARMPLAVERFPAERYAAINPDAASHSGGPFRHFIEHGQFEDRNYGNDFDNSFYRGRYKMSAHSVSPFQDFLKRLGSGPTRLPSTFSVSLALDASLHGTVVEPRSRLWECSTGYSAVIDALTSPWFAADLAAVSPLEPQLVAGSGSLRLAADREASPFSEWGAWARDAFATVNPDLVVLVPYLTPGSAEELAALVSSAATNRGYKPLVLVTDRDLCDPGVPFQGIDVLNLGGCAELIDRETALLDILRWSGVQRFLNINSKVAWQCFAKYGARLGRDVILSAYLFCWELETGNARGVQGHALDYLRESIPHLAAVLTDNTAFARELTAFIGVEEFAAKIQPVHSPLTGELGPVAIGPGRSRRRVFWVARNTAQKRFDRVVKLANSRFDWDFHCWTDIDSEQMNSLPGNVIVHKPVSSLSDIPWHEASLFLSTSDYEGLPVAMIELAHAGVPIVATCVGGVGDLIDERTGCLLDPATSESVWAAEIDEAFRDVEMVKRRAQAAHEKVRTLCDPTLFETKIVDLLFADLETENR